MLTLTATTHTLTVTTSGTSATDVVIAYADHTTTTAVLGDQQTAFSSATTQTVLAAPAASTQRQVKAVNIVNRGGANNTVTVKKDVSGTGYTVFAATLGAGEAIQYMDGRGWQVFANSGAVKNSLNQGSATISTAMSAAVLASPVTNNNAVANTIQDVTGLSFAVTSGKTYYFKFIIPFTTAVNTTGSRWSITGPTNSFLCYTSEYTLTSTTSTRNAAVVAYDSPAASNASSSGSSNIATIEGYILPTANGTVIARFASEVSASAVTAAAGAVVYYQEVI